MLKVGDKAQIKSRVEGHDFPIGTIVVVVEVYENSHDPHYAAKRLKPLQPEEKSWYVTDEEIMKIEE